MKNQIEKYKVFHTLVIKLRKDFYVLPSYRGRVKCTDNTLNE